MNLDVKCGADVNLRVRRDMFKYLKRMSRDVITHVLNVINDNELEATSPVV